MPGPGIPTAAGGALARIRAIIVGDGDVPARIELDTAWPGWDAGAAFIVAADGGATRALAAGLRPDLVVGDADSLGPHASAAVRAAGIPMEMASATKDESDLELALVAAVARGATSIAVLGALGGPRFDHALANVWLLAHPAVDGLEVVLLGAATRVRLLDASDAPAGTTLVGRLDDLVTLLPFGADAEGVTTEGLVYELSDEPLRVGPARGLSNLRTGTEARVSLRSGRLLIVETRM